MKTRMSAAALVIAGAVMATGAACGPADDGGTGVNNLEVNADLEGEFRIAAVLPLTGTFASVGKDALIGMEANVALINSEDGILGRKVVLDVRDSASETQQAVSAMRDLLADGETNAAIPDIIGSQIIATLPLVEEAGVLTVVGGGPPEAGDATKHPNNFQVVASPAQQSQAVLDKAVADGYTKIGALSNNDDSGKGYNTLLNSLAEKADVEIVSSELVDPAGTDYSGQLQKMRDAGVEVIVGNMVGTPIGVIGQALEDLGWDVPVIGTPGMASSPLSEIIPASVQGQFRYVQLRSGGLLDDKLDPMQELLLDTIKESGGKATSLSTASDGWDQIEAIKYAFDTAGTLDSAAAVAAMEGMSEDPDVGDLNWTLFIGQSPKFSAEFHNATNIDVSKAIILCKVAEPLEGGTCDAEEL